MFSYTSSAGMPAVSAILVKSLLLFAATAVLLLILRRSSAASRALAWKMCLCGMLLLPILSAALPALRLVLPYRVKMPESNWPISDESLHASSVPQRPSETIVPEAHVRAMTSIPAGSEQLMRPERLALVRQNARGFSGYAIMGIFWSLGAAMLTIRIGYSSWLLSRLRRASVDAPNSIVESGRELAKVCEVRRSVQFRIARDSESSVSPMTWGWMRPVVLLPSDASEWDQARLRPVLLHELGHIARFDWPLLVLSDLCSVIYWFHPLVWVMRRRLRIECEKACDDGVLARGLEATVYAALLVDMARTNISRSRAFLLANSLAIAMRSESCSMLSARVSAVLRPSTSRRQVSGFAATAAVLLVMAIVSPLSAARFVGAAPTGPSTPSGSVLDVAQRSFSNLVEGEQYARAVPNDDSGVRTHSNSFVRANPGDAPLRSSPPGPDYAANGVSENPQSEPVMNLREVHWGKARDGLQAGLRICDQSDSYRAGERIGLDCLIRNASTREIAFSYGNNSYYDQTPEVWDERNPDFPHKMKVTGVLLIGIDPASTVILKPGESVSFFNPGLGLGEQQSLSPGAQKTGIEKYPFLDDPTAGDYIVEQSVLYNLMSQDEVKRLAVKSRSKNAILIEPHTVRVIGSDGIAHDQASTVLMLQQGSRSLTSGPGRFTIEAKLSVAASPEPSADGDIAWGKPESGLQAGLRSPKNRSQFRIGDTIEMDYVVRNASNMRISFEHEVTPGVEGVISDIIDSNGKPTYTLGLPVLHTSELRQVTLDPGATVVVGKTRMGVLRPRGSLNDLEPNSRASNWVEATPGNYHIRHLDTLTLTGAGSGNVTLYTGYLPLDIQPAEPAASRTEAPIEPNAPKISWGKSINGLRAGLAIQSAKQRIGEDIHTELYINNTSKQDITISYIANDDKFFVPELWDAGGQHIKPDWTNPEVEQKIEGRNTLKSGESACIAHPFFGIATWRHNELAAANLFNQVGKFFVGGPGRYRVRMKAALMGAGTKWNYYPSGEVSFELAAK